jgi:hypothetical protein
MSSFLFFHKIFACGNGLWSLCLVQYQEHVPATTHGYRPYGKHLNCSAMCMRLFRLFERKWSTMEQRMIETKKMQHNG